MRIDSIPNFYRVIPDIHTNGRRILIYRIQDKTTGEITRQVPSEEKILRTERLSNAIRKRIDKLV